MDRDSNTTAERGAATVSWGVTIVSITVNYLFFCLSDTQDGARRTAWKRPCGRRARWRQSPSLRWPPCPARRWWPPCWRSSWLPSARSRDTAEAAVAAAVMARRRITRSSPSRPSTITNTWCTARRTRRRRTVTPGTSPWTRTAGRITRSDGARRSPSGSASCTPRPPHRQTSSPAANRPGPVVNRPATRTRTTRPPPAVCLIRWRRSPTYPPTTPDVTANRGFDVVFHNNI